MDSVIFNGIDADTGQYRLSLKSPCELGRWIRKALPGDPLLPSADRRFELVVEEGVCTKDLAQSGWGVVLPEEGSSAVCTALRPLLDRRQEQAGALFRELVYESGESSIEFLERYGIGAGQGPVEPTRLPYYLLLVGGPEEIPYELQHQLDLQYAVGRLHFVKTDDPTIPDLEAYGNYARSVVAAEEEELRRPLQVRFFAPENENDVATRLMSRELVEPLKDDLEKWLPGWDVKRVPPQEATKNTLGSLLGGPEAPAVLFTATHGLEYEAGHRLQPARQGALICREWQPQVWNQPVHRDHVFAADDVAPDARPAGLIAFHFACYSAGTPRRDNFVFEEPERDRSDRAPRAFSARLPQRLLSAKEAALAVIGHVDRAWTWSFSWQNRFPLLSTFKSVLRRLVSGFPVGDAARYFGIRYGELAAQLLRARAEGAHADLLGDLWTACHDARNFVVLGDPAVKLAVRGHADDPVP